MRKIFYNQITLLFHFATDAWRTMSCWNFLYKKAYFIIIRPRRPSILQDEFSIKPNFNTDVWFSLLWFISGLKRKWSNNYEPLSIEVKLRWNRGQTEVSQMWTSSFIKKPEMTYLGSWNQHYEINFQIIQFEPRSLSGKRSIWVKSTNPWDFA